ncbi:actinidain-like [Bidens hawaiensis]|uniref:actinidain-like n=1 Tax=Bidens hawaiensis TaxID=980011 RepID=UPI00404B4B60
MAQFMKQSADVLRRSIVQNARVTASATRLNGYLEEELKEMFEEWMIRYNKTYHSLEEKNKRFQIYKNTVKASKNYDPFFHPPRVKGLADLTRAEIAGPNNRAKARMLMHAYDPERGVPFVG